jgi:hypothetical protein
MEKRFRSLFGMNNQEKLAALLVFNNVLVNPILMNSPRGYTTKLSTLE